MRDSISNLTTRESSAPNKSGGRGLATKIATVGVAVGLIAFWLSVEQHGVLHTAKALMGVHASWFVMPFTVAMSLVAVSYVYKTFFWLTYRPVKSTMIHDSILPNITVVIPAYNEGAMVKKSLLSVMESNYPTESLEVICVDDGSQDDTLTYIKEVTKLFPERVRAVALPENRGKRHALYAGFRRARGEVFVTLDSDSIVETTTFRNLVAPMVHNSDVGAVAGSVRVYNRENTLVTRLLGVRYILGFDFIRAYQSQLNTVFCCPGALAAYRAKVVRPHLKSWLNQRFLGNQCTNGDDHALTNVVLREGLAVKYQSNAPIYTVVPETYIRLSKMYTRWARSNIRESYRYLKFSFTRAARRQEWLACFDGIVHALHIPLRLYLFPLSLYVLFAAPNILINSMAITTIASVIYAGIFLRSEKSSDAIYSIVYGWYAALLLGWIYPLAAITVAKNNWMTRTRENTTHNKFAKMVATSIHTK